MNKNYNTVIIGAGPGGYPCAIRLAQLKKSVLVVEARETGGVCLNRGCIPTKTLGYAAETIDNLKKAKRMGLKTEYSGVELELLRNYKDGVIRKLRAGIEYLFKNNGVEYKKGIARIISENKIEIADDAGSMQVEAENIVIATGTDIIALPGLDFDHKYVINTDDALELANIPEKMLVVGAGACGLELATIYAHLGSKVKVVEIMDQILPGMETELCDLLNNILKKNGIEIILKSTVIGYEIVNGVIHARIKKPEGETIEETDRILVTVGRKPTDESFKNIGLATDKKGYLTVNNLFQTSIKNIYAIGDIIGPPLLAHKATKQGITVAEIIAGMNSVKTANTIPSCVFTIPPLSSVGLTEKEAVAKGYRIKVGRFPYRASGKALSMGEIEGMVKIIAEEDSSILGIHILGAESPSLIGEAVLAVEKKLKPGDIAELVHPHPTFTEMLGESAENLLKKAIHIPNT